MKKPRDPLAEEVRAVKEPGRCPYCGGPLLPHCDAAIKTADHERTCEWFRCSDKRCAAYGPEEGMVIHP